MNFIPSKYFKGSLLILFFNIIIFGFGQNTRWVDHFSYRQVVDIGSVDNQIVAATNNGLFLYNLATDNVTKLSKANGLNDVQVAALTVSEDGLIVVGYQSGEIDIVYPDEILNIIDIPLDDYQGSKSINHLFLQDNNLIISANYGTSIYRIEEQEFGLTTFFTENSIYTNVNESTIVADFVYSATDEGLYYHPLDNFISNFLTWEQAEFGNFNQIVNFNNTVITASNGQLYQGVQSNFNIVRSFDNIVDLKSTNEFLTVTTSSTIYILDANFNTVQQQSFSTELSSGMTYNNAIIAGTLDEGLIISNESIYPDGPFSNSAYNVTVQDEQIWVSPGGKLNFNQPTYNREGYFHFNSEYWIHVESEDLNDSFDIVDISVSPIDSTLIYASTWNENSGLLEIQSNQLIQEYTDQNSNLPTLLRIGGTAFDEENNLWIAQSFIGPTAGNSLTKFNNGNFTVYDLSAFDNGGGGTKAPVIDRYGFAWLLGTRGDGLTATDGNEFYHIENVSSEPEDLPSLNVRALAFDARGTAWIGTTEGLRIFNNPIENLRNGSSNLNIVVITQNGLPEALLNETGILDIKVDGANRKWIATQGGGVFYVSEYGDEILEIFNEDNSPLPSNTVFAIDIDETTGRVYFATSNGLMSYGSDVTTSGDKFNEIIVYPNPVRPEFKGNITVKGLSNRANIRIIDINGNLVHKEQIKGGVLSWDGTNFQGKPVASGIYILLMTSQDGLEKATAKVAIIR